MTTATNSISASVNEPPAEDAPRRLPKLLQLTTTHLIHTYVWFFSVFLPSGVGINFFAITSFFNG